MTKFEAIFAHSKTPFPHVDCLVPRFSFVCCCFCGFKAHQCLGQRYGLKTLSTTRKPPFLMKFGLRLQVQASGFKLTTPIFEAERSNHQAIHQSTCIVIFSKSWHNHQNVSQNNYFLKTVLAIENRSLTPLWYNKIPFKNVSE